MTSSRINNVEIKPARAATLSTTAASAQNICRPKSSILKNVQVEGDVRTVYVGNTGKHYALFWSIKADGGITPEVNKNYLLFNANRKVEEPCGRRTNGGHYQH
jgi:hypothetical protein